jgi:hypothetical protein
LELVSPIIIDENFLYCCPYVFYKLDKQEILWCSKKLTWGIF